MAEAIVSLLLDRFDEILVEQAKNEMNLVKGSHSQVDNIIFQLKHLRPDLKNLENRRLDIQLYVREWLDVLEDILYDMEDLVDDWNTVILFNRIEQDSSGHKSKLWGAPRSLWKSIVLRRRTGKFGNTIEWKINDLDERLKFFVKSSNLEELITESTQFRIIEEGLVSQISYVDHLTVVCQEKHREHLIGLILQNEETMDKVKVISIVGTGGVGKTTLAQQLYNDARVVKHFDARAWICVPQRIDETKIFRAILRSMNIDSSSYLNKSLDSLRHLIISLVSQKRFLLVLDGMWDADVWEREIRDLLNGALECAVLVTTEEEEVAWYVNSNYIHFLLPLMEVYSWELVRQIVLSRGGHVFEQVGQQIMHEAKGVPLSIKCIGAMLSSKLFVEEWESVLYKLQNIRNATVVDLLTICYQDLPTSLKRCFCYCLIFVEDFNEIDADKLVRMWLAHGYLGSTGNDYRVEERGHEYVTELANRFFFHALDINDDGRIKSFSIHYLLLELAVHYYPLQFRTFDYRKNGWLDTSSQLTCRHLTILPSTEPSSSSPSSSANTRIPRPQRVFASCSHPRIRTFFAPEIEQEELQPDLFYPLRKLRVLNFSGGNLSLVPKEVRTLCYLRYLDLSSNHIEELPEFICTFCILLETIDLQDCLLFRRLPSNMGNLIMLRHLLTRNTPRLQCFPDGLEKLSKLRTLGKFMVGENFNKLRYLKYLNNLEGTLELDFYKLDDEEVGSDAEEASLKDKIYLRELKLSFNEEVGTEVSEAFEAPPNLKRLYVYGLRNKTWSNWISAPHNYLKELRINFCTRCPSLPPLWSLPSLEILDIDAMMAMKSVCLQEFLGIIKSTDSGEAIESGTEVSSSSILDSVEVAHSGTQGSAEVVPSSPSTSRRVAFPMLKKLRFNFCIEWDNWEDITEDGEIDENNVSILPSLLELEVSRCEMLTSLPHELLRRISTLRSLKIGYCRRLSDLYRDSEGRARLPMNITTIVPTLAPGEQDLELVA